ncbi:MAG: branched-chain amino acid ABC transporter permease, partial [Clostridiales bacterium]|nr:branched-chain amino acid ABC transporter permease [Clostridiales bacterium]
MAKRIKSYVINLVAAAAVYAAIMALMSRGMLNRYLTGILLTVCINVILAASLNLTTGFLGQLALGHAGFMSVG